MPDQHYVDISVVRIQQWLARTTDLKFRRGASILLSEETEQRQWKDRLPPGASWNEEAGDVDGVVSLIVEGGDAAAERVARHVAEAIKERLPYAQVHAVHGTGATYAQAYEAMERSRQGGSLLVDSPPVVSEVITARPCEMCRTAPASREHEHTEIVKNSDYADLCGECAARHEAAQGTKGDHRPPKPERRMKCALRREHGIEVKGFPDDFGGMALAGTTRPDKTSSQLALIYADGNRVGAFLHEALQHEEIEKKDIVKVIDGATIGALADAVAERYPGRERPPVLANLAGGDDLLVSVPAGDAWLFTRTLLAAFASRVEAASKPKPKPESESGPRGWPPEVHEKRPSLSAGLVFHHQKHPFADLVRLAEERLGEAKNSADGKAAAVAFLDVTADGGEVPGYRQPVTLDYLLRHQDELVRLTKTPASHREELLARLRRGEHDFVIRRVTDFEDQPMWDVIAGTRGATRKQTREKLTGDPEAIPTLRLLLDIARHYKDEPRPRSGKAAR